LGRVTDALNAPLSDRFTSPEFAIAFAETILRGYSARNKDIVPLFAAYIGVIFERNPAVGRDSLIALDRLVSASSA
jgi:hypothetical protein